VEKKLVRSIGISNFNEEMVLRVLESCNIKPVTNQVLLLHNFVAKFFLF
jgi:diketogulonate reductase-like aldo/keto reductase